jgi:PRTRC genetic system ThiF family protein
MDKMIIEPTYRVLLGEVERFRIMLVGAGGTGSTLAMFLASLAYHAGQKGIRVELTLVDHDVVEMTNCGRQNLTVQSAMMGGVPKVAELALRLNGAYGLDIVAWPEQYEADMAGYWVDYDRGPRNCAHLIIGCVDNYQARKGIAQTIAAHRGRVWAIDSGNDRYNGQVLIGNMTDVGQIKLDALGLCSGLPSPYVQEPALLEPDSTAQTLSCAELTLAEEQSLMVNRMAAVVAGQYVTSFVLEKEVRQLGTVFNLDPLAMVSRPVTKANLDKLKGSFSTAL